MIYPCSTLNVLLRFIEIHSIHLYWIRKHFKELLVTNKMIFPLVLAGKSYLSQKILTRRKFIRNFLVEVLLYCCLEVFKSTPKFPYKLQSTSYVFLLNSTYEPPPGIYSAKFKKYLKWTLNSLWFFWEYILLSCLPLDLIKFNLYIIYERSLKGAIHNLYDAKCRKWSSTKYQIYQKQKVLSSIQYSF